MLAELLKYLPQIKTVVQYGFAILVVLVFLVLKLTSDTPTIALIFIFSVVPLLIAMRFIEGLKPAFQFVIVLLISLMALAFLGTGIALSALDKTYNYDTEYHQIEPVYDDLAFRYVSSNRLGISRVTSYKDYRRLILNVYHSTGSQDLLKINRLVNFYESYLDCRKRFQCANSGIYNTRITQLWYSFRPIIEDERVGLAGPSFAKYIQRLAEEVRPPKYDSKVKKSADGLISLISEQPIQRETNIFDEILDLIR